VLYPHLAPFGLIRKMWPILIFLQHRQSHGFLPPLSHRLDHQVSLQGAAGIERERKYLVEERTSIVGRIKGLLALHGIWLTGKRIGKGLRERLDTMRTGDGRPLAPFLRRDIERMLCHYDFVSQQIEEVVADRKEALADKRGSFPHAEKVPVPFKLRLT
jgi:transposase